MQNTYFDSTRMLQTNVIAILVNWRQAHRTIEAANALALQSVPVAVVVVDNGSGDDSLSVLRKALSNVTIIAKDYNGGFGAGCNAGIEYAITMGFNYVWLINNDAIPEKQCLEQLLKKATSHSLVGVVGSCIREPSGKVIDHAGCSMNPLTLHCSSTLSETEMNENPYAWITGASMLLSMPMLQKIGLFDTEYFMYWEDADICHRIRSAGYRMAVAPLALVEHEAGTSSDKLRIQRYQWHIQSQLRWIRHHYKFIMYGVTLVYCRHIIKSILTCDWNRFKMIVISLKKDILS